MSGLFSLFMHPDNQAKLAIYDFSKAIGGASRHPTTAYAARITLHLLCSLWPRMILSFDTNPKASFEQRQ